MTTKNTRSLVSFDWAMKRLLRSKANFGILEGFLSELLRYDVQILEILESESNRDTALDKQNRIDLKARNAKGEIIIIEVQYKHQYDYLQRIFYSTSKTALEHLHKGQLYGKLVRIVSISIVYFDLGHGLDYVYRGGTHFIGLHKRDELSLNTLQRGVYTYNEPYEVFPEYYLIKVNQFDDVARDLLDEWIYFLKNSEVPEGFRAQGLEQAQEELDILKLSAPDRQAYERYQDEVRQNASEMQTSWYEGHQKGIQEGIQKGLKKGIQEGLEKGQQQERLRIARSLLDVIADDKLLADKTGLSAVEIRELRSIF